MGSRWVPVVCAMVVSAAWFGCESRQKARVRIDATALKQALGERELSRLQVRVEAPDLGDPILADVDEDDAFTLSVAPGPARKISLDAMVDDDGREVPAYFAEQTLDLEAGAEVDVVLQAHPVGVIEGELLTLDHTDLPLELDAILEHPATSDWAAAAIVINNGRFRKVAPLGESTVQATYETTKPYATSPQQKILVEHGKVTHAQLYALAKNDRCRMNVPSELTTRCVPLAVNVTGIGTETLTLKNDDDELKAGEGRSEFGLGVEVGNTYAVEMVSAPAGVTCSFSSSPSGVADVQEPPTVSITCDLGMNLRVRGLAGTLTSPLLVTVGTETVGVSADGDFPLTTRRIAGQPLAVTLAQPGSSEIDAFQCTVLSGAALASIEVRCLGAVRASFTLKPDWLGWVKRASPDTACADAPQVPDDCMHGGVHKEAHVYDRTSCAGVSAADSRGVLRWSCEPSGDHIKVVSHELMPERGLLSVIDFASCPTDGATCAFLPMALAVNDGDGARVSADALWWNNPVVRSDTPGSVAGTAAGTITVSGGTILTQLTSYFANSAVALVVMPGVQATTPAFNVAGDLDWIEAPAMLAQGAPVGSFMSVVGRRFTLRNSYIKGGPVELPDASASTVEDVAIRGSGGDGLSIGYNDGSSLYVDVSARRVRVDSSNGFGVRVAGTGGVVLEDIVSANNGLSGFYFEGSGAGANDRARVRRVTSYNNGQHGVWIDELQRSTIVDVTTFNNNAYGMHVQATPNGRDLFVANVTSVNNGVTAYVLNASAVAFSNLLAFNSFDAFGTGSSPGTFTLESFAGFAIDTNLITWSMVLGPVELRRVAAHDGTPACFDDQGTSRLAANCTTSGTDGSTDWPCGPTQCSATLRDVPLGPAFVGVVASETKNPAFATSNNQQAVAINTSGPNDALAPPWSTFENPRRGYMQNPAPGAAFPSSTQRGRCGGTSECTAFDFRTKAGGMLHDALPPLSAADALSFVRFRSPTADQTFCTLNYPGTASIALLPSSDLGCAVTYAAGAVEIDDDIIGNDNGYCEAGEDCLVATNFGADQGSGPLVAAGTFSLGGGVVRLFRFTTTGQ
ncbi:MAG: right-handed parallel beta-helix repeat-containing protein [Deltaproteobacteria bacterium]|nr:right-handed parallel beta-helix repeat-containing protein [Deltaproteobacteria bacterium]